MGSPAQCHRFLFCLRLSQGQDLSQPVSPLSGIRREYGRNVGETDFGKTDSSPLGARRREYGKPLCVEEFGTPQKLGPVSPSVMRRMSSPAVAEEKIPSSLSPSVLRRTSPSAEDKPSRSSSALSEYVEELRRLKDKEPGTLGLGEASSLPIYQMTGASSLRRCRTLNDDEEDLPVKLDELGGGAGAGLFRSSSLRSVLSESMVQPPLSPALKRVSQFGSYDSLVQSTTSTSPKLSSPGASRLRPWRSCLEASLEETSDVDLGAEPLVFQSRRVCDVPSEGKESEPFSWRIPTLNYERKTGVDLDEFLPAIRKSQSASSLSRGPKERKEGQRPLSVHFEDQISFLPETKTTGATGSAPKEDPGNLSDSSSSSGSVVSFKSADSIKSRPRVQRLEGEGCVGKAGTEGTADGWRSEAEGKEDDVNSIMMKYLGKE